jgi:hypothetical protein
MALITDYKDKKSKKKRNKNGIGAITGRIRTY